MEDDNTVELNIEKTTEGIFDFKACNLNTINTWHRRESWMTKAKCAGKR